MTKLSPYEKELKRRIRKLIKQETLLLKTIEQHVTIVDSACKEIRELANQYNTDDMVKAEDVHSHLMVILRRMMAN